MKHRPPFNSLRLTVWRIYAVASANEAIIVSDNVLLPVWRQAIIRTNAGLLLIRHLGTNFSEILIEIQTFSLKKISFKMSSAKWLPFFLGLNVIKTESSRVTQVRYHYGDVIMGAISSQITRLSIVYSIVYCDADQRENQSSTSLVHQQKEYLTPKHCDVSV